MESQLFEGIVSCVVFTISHGDREIVERCIFDIDLFPVVPKDQASVVLDGLSISLVDIQQQLRTTVGGLVNGTGKLSPLC